MIKLKSEGYFEAALTNARLKLTLLSRHDLDLETKLEAFAKEKETYSQFCVDKVKGTHGCRNRIMRARFAILTITTQKTISIVSSILLLSRIYSLANSVMST